MNKEPYPGIDYGGPGSTVNRDLGSGIHYGVIGCNSVGQSLYDSQEFDYGPPHCPFCGTEIPEDLNQNDDQVCPHCGGEDIDVSDCYPDEPAGWHIDDGEYVITDCLRNDAMVIKSPYYTYAQFCSPCVPGAGNLDNAYTPKRDGLISRLLPETVRMLAESAGFPKVFCLGYDWFDEFNPCPYPVMFRVDSNEPVLSQSTEGS